MKIRYDFVTNSSSSSFILSKDVPISSIQDVYFLVRDLYVDYCKKIQELQDICSKKPESYPIGVRDGEFYFKDPDKRFSDETQEAISELEELSGLEEYDFVYASLKGMEWVEKCGTYEEYKNYWLDRMYRVEHYDYHIHAPFSICDYTQDTYDALHWHTYKYDHKQPPKKAMKYLDSCEHPINKTKNNSELSWYFDCVDTCDKSCLTKSKCKYLDHRTSFYEMDKKKCEELKQCAVKGIDGEELILKLLGRFVVLSESGYIPDAVVEQLVELSKYSCNHMG